MSVLYVGNAADADISPDFVHDAQDEKVAKALADVWETPFALRVFEENQHRLTDYGYWYLLSTLWVSYSGWTELPRWKTLFASDRPKRETSIMKPSELVVYREMPPICGVYRAHRPNETDWIAYTFRPETAARFAAERGVNEVKQYAVAREDVLAVFTRREESEVIVLDRTKARYFKTHPVTVTTDLPPGEVVLNWDETVQAVRP